MIWHCCHILTFIRTIQAKHSFNWPDPFKKEVLQSKLKIPFTLKNIGNKDGILKSTIEWVMLFKKEV